MQKGFGVIYILVGILILVSVAGGAYYLGRQTPSKPSPAPVVTSQTPQPTSTSSPVDETSDWKTYTNEKYKFTLQYPPNVTYKNEDRVFGPPDEHKKYYPVVIFNINRGSLTITVNDPFEGYSPQTAFTQGTLESNGISITGISIAGIKTDKLLYSSKTAGNIRAVASPLGDKIYFDFTLPQDETERLVVDKIIDQILSTFKFIN